MSGPAADADDLGVETQRPGVASREVETGVKRIHHVRSWDGIDMRKRRFLQEQSIESSDVLCGH